MSREPYNYKAVDVRALLMALGLDAKREGDLWKARCPNHSEKTPSWTIIDRPGDEKHGLHHCFGCEFNGTAVKLVSHVTGLSMPGAIDWINERAMGRSAPISRIVVEHAPLTGRVFEFPREVCFDPLDAWVRPAREYLLKRHITREQVERWHIGYAVDGRLAGRIVIPVFDSRGRPASYMARTFVDHPRRYMGPDEAKERPDLGAVFGEQHWPQIDLRGVIIVTEGAINGLACERVSKLPIAALAGSSIRLTHLMKIATFKRVLILTDPDPAGDKAADEISGALSRHATTLRVRLPVGMDADGVPPHQLKDEIETALLSAQWLVETSSILHSTSSRLTR
jgi:DNA primase